jgi:hypothetical protein
VAGKAQSLDAWLHDNEPLRSSYWNDVLPADIRAQIVASDASTARVTAWLHSIGFEDATPQKIDPPRRRERQRRERHTEPG